MRKNIKVDSIIKYRERESNWAKDAATKAREAGLLFDPRTDRPWAKTPGPIVGWTTRLQNDRGQTNAGSNSFRYNHIKARHGSQAPLRRFINRQDRRRVNQACRVGKTDSYVPILP